MKWAVDEHLCSQRIVTNCGMPTNRAAYRRTSLLFSVTDLSEIELLSYCLLTVFTKHSSSKVRICIPMAKVKASNEFLWVWKIFYSKYLIQLKTKSKKLSDKEGTRKKLIYAIGNWKEEWAGSRRKRAEDYILGLISLCMISNDDLNGNKWW